MISVPIGRGGHSYEASSANYLCHYQLRTFYSPKILCLSSLPPLSLPIFPLQPPTSPGMNAPWVVTDPQAQMKKRLGEEKDHCLILERLNRRQLAKSKLRFGYGPILGPGCLSNMLWLTHPIPDTLYACS